MHATIGEIAAAERINPSYASRVLRLTLLAPEIVEAILDGRQGPEVTLDRLLRPFPVEWERQAEAIRDHQRPSCGLWKASLSG